MQLRMALVMFSSLLASGALAEEPDPFVDRVVTYTVGEGGGYGEKMLPKIVLGPPHGGGKLQAGSDVFSLGKGGSIVLEFVDNEVVDGPGADLLIFENPFLQDPGDDENLGHFELAKVEVSFDGKEWKLFPYDMASRKGCAGHRPVFANSDTAEGRDLSPTDPEQAGGDAFDLADVELKVVRFVRITDLGNAAGEKGTAGFDLDGVAAVHSRPRK